MVRNTIINLRTSQSYSIPLRNATQSLSKHRSTWQCWGNTSLRRQRWWRREGKIITGYRAIFFLLTPSPDFLQPLHPSHPLTCWLPNGSYPLLHLYPHLDSDNTPVMNADGALWWLLPVYENCGSGKISWSGWGCKEKTRRDSYEGRRRKRKNDMEWENKLRERREKRKEIEIVIIVNGDWLCEDIQRGRDERAMGEGNERGRVIWSW